MHNVVTSKAIGYWRNPNLTRAWNSWTTLVLARERHLKADFAQKCLQPTSRAHLGLVLRMWFNVQGLKAFNTWKALYILQSDLRKDKQKAVATLGAGLTMEEELRAETKHKDEAQLRSLSKLIQRRAGMVDEAEQDIPTWVPLWALVFYLAWRRLKLWVLRNAIRSYAWLLKFSRSQSLDDVSTIVVGINVLSMTLPHTSDSAFGRVWGSLRQHARFHAALDYLNVSVASFFLLELLLKFWGWGPKGYFVGGGKNKEFHIRWANVFDFIITAISAAEMDSMINSAECALHADRLRDCASATNFMLLRVLRLLRLARLLRQFPNFQQQVAIAIQVWFEIAASFALLCLFLMVYAILGISLFGGRLREPFVPDLARSSPTPLHSVILLLRKEWLSSLDSCENPPTCSRTHLLTFAARIEIPLRSTCQRRAACVRAHGS
jgi:hypothetical protein